MESEVNNLQHHTIPQNFPSEGITTPQDPVSPPVCSVMTHRGGENTDLIL